MNNRSLQGFTLSELLVSLAILGVIAAFSIPKILTSVGESSARAIGREALGMIAESYQALRANNNGNVNRSTTAQALINVMNFSRQEALANGGGTTARILLQSGATIGFIPADNFDPGVLRGSIGFTIDPDGAGTVNGPVTAYLGSDGRTWLAYGNYAAATVAAGLPSPFNAAVVTAATLGYNPVVNTGVTLIPPAPGNNDNTSTTWCDWNAEGVA